MAIEFMHHVRDEVDTEAVHSDVDLSRDALIKESALSPLVIKMSSVINTVAGRRP